MSFFALNDSGDFSVGDTGTGIFAVVSGAVAVSVSDPDPHGSK